MSTDIPASNSCLTNSKSLLGSAGDPKHLSSLLTPLASSAGAEGLGPAWVIVAHLWEEAVKTERGRENSDGSTQTLSSPWGEAGGMTLLARVSRGG